MGHVTYRAVPPEVIDRDPSLFPSYARLSPEHRALVYSCLKVPFNFGQFLQAENLPGNLSPGALIRAQGMRSFEVNLAAT